MVINYHSYNLLEVCYFDCCGKQVKKWQYICTVIYYGMVQKMKTRFVLGYSVEC